MKNNYIVPLLLIFLFVAVSCEKYDDDPSRRGYTPDAVDDNSWTADIMYEDSIVSGLNPKDSVFIGTAVYEFSNHYKGMIMKVEGDRLLSRNNQAILVRAVDADHINIALKECAVDGEKKDIVVKNIPINKGKDGVVTFASSTLQIEGTLKGSQLRISGLSDDVHFDYLSTDAYKYDYPQIENGDFETWTYDGDNLPNCWNSLQTARGEYSSLYYVKNNRQVEKTTLTRPGSVGRYSCKIWTNQIIGLIIPGTLTTGCMNINSMMSNKPVNYINTLRGSTFVSQDRANPYSMPFEGMPDSIVFWANYYAQDFSAYDENGNEAKLHLSGSFTAVIHDDYDYKAYNDSEYIDKDMEAHVVAKASTTIPLRDGVWQRISIPFEYTSLRNPKYILVTAKTSSVLDAGSIGDYLYIDDVECVYNLKSEE